MIEESLKLDIDFSKNDGIVPVIVQEYQTQEVLMLAYANKQAVDLTISTGFAHYFSRSRNSLWKKGETSNNVQEIVEIRIDCDLDTLLYIVKQRGNACHTERHSCFYRKVAENKLEFIKD